MLAIGTLREMDSLTQVTTTTMFHRDNRQIGFLLHRLELAMKIARKLDINTEKLFYFE